ncbi:Histone-lysine N-methyltransferase set9 [Xylographa opegraphella]|nr:Histone-lysine N-methyltransferase set9 [Xylographa opegraphella]
MSLKDVAVRRERLTLTQLASYDDILTDALVDHVYFWTTIRKNRAKYNLTRGISEDDITNILLHQVVVRKNVQQAEDHLLKLSGLRKFIERLKTNREKEDFRRHMRKYVNIWLPDCPFEVATTNRYTIVTQEAAATARRFIKKGETIKYLCGNLVAMTAEEEKDLDLTRRDFSIVMSSRKKTPSLFLGPARFANHDCNANARLVTRGSDGMEVVAVRNIDVKEEITVTYGDDYFGAGNSECLCRTCELEERNGWVDQDVSKTTSGMSTPAALEVEESTRPYSFRNKRKYNFCAESVLDSAEIDIELPTPAKRRKSTPVRSSSAESKATESSVEARDDISNAHGSGLSSKMQVPTSDGGAAELSEDELCHDPIAVQGKVASSSIRRPKTKARKSILDRVNKIFSADWKRSVSPLPPSKVEHTDASAKATKLLRTPTSLKQNDLPNSHASSDAESIFDREQRGTSSPASTPSRNHEESSTPLLENIETKTMGPIVLVFNDPNTVEVAPPAQSRNAENFETFNFSDTELSELSELSPSEVFDDSSMTIVRKAISKTIATANLKSKSGLFTRTRKTAPEAPATLETPKSRHPGDYTRTPLLLSEPFSRWVDCNTCGSTWVQPNGYYTRKECPRCERHSKLYGYRWPKTESLKGERVGRVMDHRTVHRFVGPEEERRVKRRGKGCVSEVGVGGESIVEGASEPEPEEQSRGARRGTRPRAVAMV